MKRLYDLLTIIAMIAAPTAAAIYFGWHIYADIMRVTGVLFLAILAGLAAAVTLESVGALAGHNASEFWEKRDGRWKVAALIMGLYLFAGLSELWGTPGAVIFALSPAVYLLSALRQTAAKTEAVQQVEAIEDKAYQRQQAERDKERQHQLDQLRIQNDQALAIEQRRIAAEADVERERIKVERIRANAEQKEQARLLLELQRQEQEAEQEAEQASIEPDASGFECEDCNQPFATVQALNAHGRWCKAKVPAASNGNGHKVI